MDHSIIKKLIDEDIIDFDKLIIKNYKQIGLSENEAFLLIELNNQKKMGDTYISPSRLAKKMTLKEEKIMQLLDALIQRRYINIRLIKVDGKDTEDFGFEETIKKLIDIYKTKIKHEITSSEKTYDTFEEEVVDILESQFQKQLKPLEIELISKWVNEDRYDIIDIRKAILDAVKSNKSSISYIDGVLVKRSKNKKKTSNKKYNPDKSEALKAFYDTWNE